MNVKSGPHGQPVVELNGKIYGLGGIPSSPESRAKLMAPGFKETFGVLPKSEWKEVNNRERFKFIMDQKSHGSCVGHGSARGLMCARDFAGMKHVDLSGTFIYSYINGNRDQGAMISDAVDVLKDKGTCTYQKCPWDTIYQRNISDDARKEAQRYRALEIYTVGDEPFEEFASAINLGFFPVFAVMVGNTFMRLDSNGVCGFDRGPGNHCVMADGLKKLSNGQWVADMANSWNLDFGDNGRAYLTEQHVEAVQQDCYIVRAAADDPNDPDAPPTIVN